MANKSRVDPVIAKELLLEGKNNQSFVDVLAQETDSSLPPCPELRRNVIHDWNAAFVHCPRYSPIECRRVNDDGKVGFVLVGFGNQLVKQAPDFWQVRQDFGDADDRQIFRIDDGVASRGAHALTSDPEELHRMCGAGALARELKRSSGVGRTIYGSLASSGALYGLYELRAVHFAGSCA